MCEKYECLFMVKKKIKIIEQNSISTYYRLNVGVSLPQNSYVEIKFPM